MKVFIVNGYSSNDSVCIKILRVHITLVAQLQNYSTTINLFVFCFASSHQAFIGVRSYNRAA